MKKISPLRRFAATGLVALALIVGRGLQAQPNTEVPRQNPSVPEQPSQAELLESYRQLREQLRTAEQAIVNNRLEAEAAANARTAALTEKIDTLKLALLTEQDRLQKEARLSALEREQQQVTAQAMTQDILRLVLVFGAAGLLALVVIAVLQWRSNRRLAEYIIPLQSYALPPQAALPSAGPAAPGGEAVAAANQRLVTMLDRMERRVNELEETVAAPPPTPAPGPMPAANGGTTGVRKVLHHPISAATRAAQIATLLDQGQSLLNAKKPIESLACFDEILSLEANHAEALLKKGTALERLQKNEAALLHYNLAIEADPNLALAYIAKGGLCVRLERFEEAYDSYTQAMQAGKSVPLGRATRVSVTAE